MLKRKIQSYIEEHLSHDDRRILVIDGARQVGKTFIVRHVGQRMFANYIELNMEEDAMGQRLFANVSTKDDFYLALSVAAGDKMGRREDTLVFIDEIQRYSQLLSLLKFLAADGRFTYIASGSLLGVTLRLSPSLPMGSIDIQHIYPLDFEEFLWANGVGESAVEVMRQAFARCQPMAAAVHTRLMSLFRRYLLTGGMPSAVEAFVKESNIVKVRNIQKQIYELYKIDASRYENAMGKLKIRRVYDMIPSNMESRKKRMVAKNIEDIKGKRMDSYRDEFEYLISSGIALEVKAVSKPSYPLLQSSGKNLMKLYLNDVGLLTAVLYGINIQPVMDDKCSINLGAVYETVVAQELHAHSHEALYYYDSKKNGEVDYIIDDSNTLSVVPIEVKSGRDYRIHSAINNLLAVKEYNIQKAYIVSNAREVTVDGAIIYIPAYYVMFL